MSDLNKFNFRDRSRYEIAKVAGVSYPTVMKYLDNEAQEPSMMHVALVLSGMGVDWRAITLGELIEETKIEKAPAS